MLPLSTLCTNICSYALSTAGARRLATRPQRFPEDPPQGASETTHHELLVELAHRTNPQTAIGVVSAGPGAVFNPHDPGDLAGGESRYCIGCVLRARARASARHADLHGKGIYTRHLLPLWPWREITMNDVHWTGAIVVVAPEMRQLALGIIHRGLTAWAITYRFVARVGSDCRHSPQMGLLFDG